MFEILPRRVSYRFFILVIALQSIISFDVCGYGSIKMSEIRKLRHFDRNTQSVSHLPAHQFLFRRIIRLHEPARPKFPFHAFGCKQKFHTNQLIF